MSRTVFVILCGSVVLVAFLSVAVSARRSGARAAAAIVSLLIVGAFWLMRDAFGRGEAFGSGSWAVDLAALVSLVFVPLIAVQYLRESLGRAVPMRWDAGARRQPSDVVVPAEGLARSDVRGHRSRADRLALAQRHFESFALQSRAGLWMYDVSAAELVWVSPAFESIWGRPADDLYADIGRRRGAIHDEDRARVVAALERAVAGNKYAEEYRVQRPDGTVAWVWDHAVAVRNEKGEVVSVVGLAEDISERKGIEEVNLFRANFVANMSHEVRTPLNIMIGYLEFLLDGTFGDLSPPQRDVAARVRTNAEELLELMSASLDLSRLDNRAIPLALEAIDLASLFAEVVTDASTLVDERPVTLRWEVMDDVPMIVSDRQKLKMVLKNLLSNAAKFTREGEIVATARACDGVVELVVRDTGSGIAPETLPRVFEPFRQGGDSETKAGGVGLGLYIVRRLVDILEGRISVESAPAQGATFRVRLPVALAADRDGDSLAS